MDVLKEAAATRRNAKLNPDAKVEEESASNGDTLRDERAIARPQPTVHKEKPVRIIVFSTTAAKPGQARQLPWVIRGNATPNKTWLAFPKQSTLQELGEAACRYCEDDKHSR